MSKTAITGPEAQVCHTSTEFRSMELTFGNIEQIVKEWCIEHHGFSRGADLDIFDNFGGASIKEETTIDASEA